MLKDKFTEYSLGLFAAYPYIKFNDQDLISIGNKRFVLLPFRAEIGDVLKPLPIDNPESFNGENFRELIVGGDFEILIRKTANSLEFDPISEAAFGKKWEQIIKKIKSEKTIIDFAEYSKLYFAKYPNGCLSLFLTYVKINEK